MPDENIMDSIYTLLTYLFKITIVGSLVLFCFKLLEQKKKNEAKNYIQSLNAKLSILRINLRGKMKKKSHKYRSLFKTSISAGDPIDVALNELIDLKLETSDEFQRYFDLSKRINYLLKTENVKTPEKDKADKTADDKPEKPKFAEPVREPLGNEDFMGTDFKSEISIIRVIKDMVEISKVLHRRIQAYNSSNPRNPIAEVMSIHFPSLAEVNMVFKKEQINSEDDSAETAA